MSEAQPSGGSRPEAELDHQDAGQDAPRSSTTTIRWEKDADGVVILTLDDPNQSANTMNAAYAASIAATVDRLESERDEITGVIITSAKKTFFAGGDLNDLKAATREHSDEIAKWVHDGQGRAAAPGDARQAGRRRRQRRGARRRARDHARLPPPDRRRRPDDPARLPRGPARPAARAGGVTRTVRMLGIVNALMQLLLQGQRVRPEKGKEIGIVDELVATPTS